MHTNTLNIHAVDNTLIWGLHRLTSITYSSNVMVIVIVSTGNITLLLHVVYLQISRSGDKNGHRCDARLSGYKLGGYPN